MKYKPSKKPSIILIGGGAAGLWTALALLEEGWSGAELTIVEPSGKTKDDRTWSYWAKESLLPIDVEQSSYSKIIVASDGKRKTYTLDAYRYYSVRSSKFYAYAKGVLAKAGVTWSLAKATRVSENSDQVEVELDKNTSISAEFVLDSRPPNVEIPSTRYNATLQHFGGWFVQMASAAFDPDEVIFMDFIALKQGVGFFYVIPSSSTEALVEIAVFSENPWSKSDYNEQISAYILKQYSHQPQTIVEREYGAIPMTDEPLWKGSTHRVWNIGTRGGWVQPSSGYAFTRTKRFAEEVAKRLKVSAPKPWVPSSTQQVFNSVMLGYIIDNPTKAGTIFYQLFERNGTTRTFDFLDEASSVEQTIRLMWTSPQVPFAVRAIKEAAARVFRIK